MLSHSVSLVVVSYRIVRKKYSVEIVKNRQSRKKTTENLFKLY